MHMQSKNIDGVVCKQNHRVEERFRPCPCLLITPATQIGDAIQALLALLFADIEINDLPTTTLASSNSYHSGYNHVCSCEFFLHALTMQALQRVQE